MLGLLVATGDWGHGNAQPITQVTILAPPAGIALPSGQAVEVLCRVIGESSQITLYANGGWVSTMQRRQAEPIVRFTWSPSTEGVSCLGVQAMDSIARPMGSDEHCLTILSSDASIWLHAEP